MRPYREEYVRQEAACVEEGFHFLGWDNGWAATPQRVLDCRQKAHNQQAPRVTFDVQANDTGSVNIRGCSVCRWYSKYDCSG